MTEGGQLLGRGEKGKKRRTDEQDREHGEAHELDGLAAPGVDEEEANPVAGDKAGSGEDEVADADVVHVVVDALRAGGLRGPEPYGVEDDAGVEAEAVERDLSRRMSNMEVSNR